MKRALVAVAALAAALVTAPSGAAKPPAASYDPCPGPLSCGIDLETALGLEAESDHLRHGFMVPLHYRTPEKVPGEVNGTGGWGDSGLWTGVYLGGQSFRYATAKDKLAELAKSKDKSNGHGKGQAKRGDGLSDEERAALVAFWTGQRDESLAKTRAMVTAFHRNVNIAAAWQTTTKVPPSVNPSNSKQPIDFGGGIIKGEPGMLMRSCTPTDDPIGISKNDRVFGPWLWEDGKKYVCETAPSRDTYAGTTFGMLTAFDLVSVDDPAMRTMLRDDLVKMGEFLLKYGWNYPRPHGYVSAQHDFDNFVSPLFVYVPMARLNLTNAVRHVAGLVGDAATKQKWDAVWAEEFAVQGAELAASMEVDSVQPNDGYYKFNLHHLTAFNLLRTTSGAERQLVLDAVAVMDKTTRDDINAHFEAITFAMTGERARGQAAVTHLREWRDYRALMDTGGMPANTSQCGKDFACVQQDQYEVATPAGDVAWFPGQPDVNVAGTSVVKKKDLRAARPLPVSIRANTDFLWQRPPTALGRPFDLNGQEPGIDYLTPYWMLRYYTEVVDPASTPMPDWAGPAHR